MRTKGWFCTFHLTLNRHVTAQYTYYIIYDILNYSIYSYTLGSLSPHKYKYIYLHYFKKCLWIRIKLYIRQYSAFMNVSYKYYWTFSNNGLFSDKINSSSSTKVSLWNNVIEQELLLINHSHEKYTIWKLTKISVTKIICFVTRICWSCTIP